MKSVAKAVTKRAKAKARVVTGKIYRVVVDEDGKLPMPYEITKRMNIKAGDEFVAWKDGDDFIVTFPKTKRCKLKTPKDAIRGKVE